MEALAKKVREIFRCRVRVIDVLDGDTIRVALRLAEGLEQIEDVRLQHVNARNIKSEEGATAARILKSKLEGVNRLYLTWYKREKFGRLLGILWPDTNGENIELAALEVYWRSLSINGRLLDHPEYEAYEGVGAHKESVEPILEPLSEVQKAMGTLLTALFPASGDWIHRHGQPLACAKPKVTIHVRGGVAEYETTGDVEVTLIDHDSLEPGAI